MWRFTHRKRFVVDLKLDMAFVLFTIGVRHKGLCEKFTLESLATLKESMKMVARYI